MKKAHAPRRCIAALGIIVAGVFLLCCSDAFALDPALDVSQYAHTAWKVRDGFFKSHISVIAQTPDGYLWLGTEFGLLRFGSERFHFRLARYLRRRIRKDSETTLS